MIKRLKGFLTELGKVIVGEAANGKDGFEMYKELKPDIVFLDINMPVMSGRDALVHIIDFDPEAKIVMCSTEGSEEIIEECIENGAIYYIIKPYIADNVKQSLRDIESLLQT